MTKNVVFCLVFIWAAVPFSGEHSCPKCQKVKEVYIFTTASFRKFGLFRGELPVPMENVAQAENAHTHGERPCTAHGGEAPTVEPLTAPLVVGLNKRPGRPPMGSGGIDAAGVIMRQVINWPDRGPRRR